MHFLSRLVVLGTLLISTLPTMAQWQHFADTTLPVSYNEQDSIFVYCGEIPAETTIGVRDTSDEGGYAFSWYQFNETSKAFDVVLTDFTVAPDGASSQLSAIVQGGIRAVLSKGALEQVYTVWVFEDKDLAITLNVIDPLDCDLLELQGTPETSGFQYYNPTSGEAIAFVNGPEEYQWKSDPESSIPNYNYNYTSTANLPVEDTKFSLIMTDIAGCEVGAEREYTAIATDAIVETSFWDEDQERFESSESPEGPSPLIVQFVNRSVNGSEYLYFYGDTLINDDEDSLRTTDFALSPEHTYYYTRKYNAWLYSYSVAGCVDSVSVEVNVSPSKLDLINSFSPNGDNYLDRFVIEDESIRYINIAIYTRSGVKVHSYEGDIADWDGWDGKNKGRAEASEGVYFYVIEAKGWDDISYNEKGTLYLFR